MFPHVAQTGLEHSVPFVSPVLGLEMDTTTLRLTGVIDILGDTSLLGV